MKKNPFETRTKEDHKKRVILTYNCVRNDNNCMFVSFLFIFIATEQHTQN